MPSSDAILSWLQNNWFGVIGLCSTFVFGAIIYRWQKREKAPLYLKRTFNLIGDATRYPSLQIHYKGHGEDINQFSVSVIAIWNGGREPIDGKDIAAANPLMITVNEGIRILDASIIQTNRAVNLPKCDYSKDGNYVKLRFDYLNYGHGFVMEVLHTGTKADLIVSGSFKGSEDIRVNKDPSRFRFLERMFRSPYRKMRRRALIFIFVMWVGCLVSLAGLLFNREWEEAKVVEVNGKEYLIPNDHEVKIEGGSTKLLRRAPTIIYLAMVIAALVATLQFWLVYRSVATGVPSDLNLFEDHPLGT